MKRPLAVFLMIILLFSVLGVSALADGDELPSGTGSPPEGIVSETPAVSIRESAFAPSASLIEYRKLFREPEWQSADAVLTKAMAVAVLSRHACGGNDPAITGMDCADIDYESWYAPGITWALREGLLTAEDGCVSPDAEMTREELCSLLAGYASLTGCTLPIINTRYSFLDAGLFPPAEREAAAKLQQAGVMIEAEDGLFHLSDTVSVSEARGIFLRLFAVLYNPLEGLPTATVPESAPVGNDWFDDVCFIGHSQVVGMEKYFDLPNADYYAVIGHTARQVLEFEYYSMPNGGMGTLQKALGQKSYGKVYIMLGINDCTLKEDRVEEFLTPMRRILDMVKETQPNAQVYLLSLAPVGRMTRNNEYYNRANAILYSQAVKQLSREYGTEYLDVYRLLCDHEGFFRDEVNAGDGIHINANQYYLIEDYLKSHTIASN